MSERKLFTSESVSKGYPDKINVFNYVTFSPSRSVGA